MRTIKVITHFPTDDPECDGDYYDVEVFDQCGTRIVAYGDGYHDRGEEKVDGLIAGLRYESDEEIKVVRVDIADREV